MLFLLYSLQAKKAEFHFTAFDLQSISCGALIHCSLKECCGSSSAGSLPN